MIYAITLKNHPIEFHGTGLSTTMDLLLEVDDECNIESIEAMTVYIDGKAVAQDVELDYDIYDQQIDHDKLITAFNEAQQEVSEAQAELAMDIMREEGSW